MIRLVAEGVLEAQHCSVRRKHDLEHAGESARSREISNSHREKTWHRAFRQGLAPIGTGLIISSVIAILQMSGGGFLAIGLAVLSAILLVLLPKLPAPIFLLGGAGVAVFCHLAIS